MAKQTFTTGQVLTAAQMTSLQQTAMGGGSPSTKTASYVLVAADAGTVIQMNAAGSTTITVNTALFSAGDSVQIQNIGAGVCTITAGTATVNTAGSLALSQWEGGFLYFTSASSAIFFDVVQSSGMTNPMTTAGDTIYGGASGTPTRLAIGTANQQLRVNSGATAPEWFTPAASTSGLTLVKQQTIGSSVTSVTVTSAFSSTYDNYRILISGGSGTASGSITMQLGSTTTGYYLAGFYQSFSATPTMTAYGFTNGSSFNVGYMSANGIGSMIDINNPNLADETVFGVRQITLATNGTLAQYQGYLNNTTSYTAFTLTFEVAQTGGEIRVYGYQNS